MAGTQAPKGFGILFVLVGIPLILWSAWGTNESIAALDSTEARQKQCVAKTAALSISPDDAESMCSCVVEEAKERGIFKPHGAYDEKALRPVVDMCLEANVQE